VRILLAEEEAGILAFLSRALRAEGFAVECGTNRTDACARARQGAHDLVLLDVRLPEDFDVLREVVASDRTRPVVVLSARGDLPTKLRAFALGASDYLAKPFALDELLARVRAQLRARGLSDSASRLVRLGALTLDLVRHEATVGDRSVNLTDREFRLLHYLGEHPEEAVSRERLLADVWGYHFDPRSNVVDVCIRRIRRKLGARSPIETVRNVGYRAHA
jgi:two-component system, OmpR family, copper resistance phosphate regulon response regulator CusR